MRIPTLLHLARAESFDSIEITTDSAYDQKGFWIGRIIVIGKWKTLEVFRLVFPRLKVSDAIQQLPKYLEEVEKIAAKQIEYKQVFACLQPGCPNRATYELRLMQLWNPNKNQYQDCQDIYLRNFCEHHANRGTGNPQDCVSVYTVLRGPSQLEEVSIAPDYLIIPI